MSEWIKVSERLPEHGVCVLITFGSMNLVNIATYYHGLKGKWLDAIRGTEEYEPTHWQPLPEPPKRESSFEQWWNRNCHGWHDIGTLAKAAWDAGAKASQGPDFVP